MTQTRMDIIINTNPDSVDISREFVKQVHKSIDEYNNDPEEFIRECVSKSIHCVKARRSLGSYRRVDARDTAVKCGMCNDAFKTTQYKRELPCGHHFHKRCIDLWLFRYYSKACPCCKKCIYN